jgi:hypothetical protein
VAHESNVARLTAKEMSALASRLEARAGSFLLSDQPQMQSDMRLAARLINEFISECSLINDWTMRDRSSGGAPSYPERPTETNSPAIGEVANT